LRHGGHGGLEVLARHRSGRFRLGDIDRARQRAFLALAIKRGIGPPDIVALIALLLDADDIGGAFVAGEQSLAVLGIEKSSERLDAPDDQQQHIIRVNAEQLGRELRIRPQLSPWAMINDLPYGEHCIHKIVSSTLLSQLHLQTIIDESEQIEGAGHCINRWREPIKVVPKYEDKAQPQLII